MLSNNLFRMKRNILLGFLLLLSLCASAQSIEQSVRQDRAGQGHVDLHIAPAVYQAMTKPLNARVEEQEETMEDKIRKAREFRDAEKVKARGFRILVYAGGNKRSDKQKVEEVGEQMKRLFPLYPVYAHFESPRWVCRLGNFTKREEANEVLQEVRDAGFRQAIVTEGVILIAK